MIIKIRLYKLHDYDLCKLYITHGFNFSYNMKKVLRNYASLKKGVILTPLEISEKAPPSKIEIKITLDDFKDADVIAVLRGIKARQRNSFLKSLFRQCLDGNILVAYFDSDYDGIKPFFGNEEKLVIAADKGVKTEEMVDKSGKSKKPVTAAKEKTNLKKQDASQKSSNVLKEQKPKENAITQAIEEACSLPSKEEQEADATNIFGMFGNLIENY